MVPQRPRLTAAAPGRHRLLWALAAVGFIAAAPAPSTMSAPATAPEPTPATRLPYRVRVVLAFADQVRLTPRFRRFTQQRVAVGLDRTMGYAWDVTIEPSPPLLSDVTATALEAVTPDALKDAAADHDKLIILCVRWEQDHFDLFGRELDVATGLLGPTFRQTAVARRLVGDRLSAMAARMFRPLATVQRRGRRSVQLTARGGELLTPDPLVRILAAGTIFRPIRQHMDRKGNLGELKTIPWTLLKVQQPDGPTAVARIRTGLRNPMTIRRRGRWRFTALGVKSANRDTTLELINARSQMALPLGGQDVYISYDRSKPGYHYGTTDRYGRLRVTPRSPVTEIVFAMVRSGREALARLPFVPGAEALPPARVRTDDVRLDVEGRILSLQEDVLGQIARERLVERHIKKKQFLAAKELLPTVQAPEVFLKRLKAIKEQALAAAERQGTGALSAKTRKLFDETEQFIADYLIKGRVEKLKQQLGKAGP